MIYCSECGKPVVKKLISVVNGDKFDWETGEEINEKHFTFRDVCPNHRWFNLHYYGEQYGHTETDFNTGYNQALKEAIELIRSENVAESETKE